MSDKERAVFEAWYRNTYFMDLADGWIQEEKTAMHMYNAWLHSTARAAKRIAELEDVADKLFQSLQEVLQMQVNGHDLQDRMQFSMPGRAIGGKAYAARKLYEAMKGGA
jgi:hypothetical protein